MKKCNQDAKRTFQTLITNEECYQEITGKLPHVAMCNSLQELEPWQGAVIGNRGFYSSVEISVAFF